MKKYQRRSQTEWQTLIQEQQISGISAPAFCKQQAVAYPSFIQWKKKLGGSGTEPIRPSSEQAPSFVEITPIDELPVVDIAESRVCRVELDLGQGLQLRIF